MNTKTEPWHLDKRIPIALILAIILQTGAAVWWFSDIVHRLDSAIEANGNQDSRIATIEGAMSVQAVNAATLAAQIAAVRDSLKEMRAQQDETNQLLRDLIAKQ